MLTELVYIIFILSVFMRVLTLILKYKICMISKFFIKFVLTAN